MFLFDTVKCKGMQVVLRIWRSETLTCGLHNIFSGDVCLVVTCSHDLSVTVLKIASFMCFLLC